VKPALLLLAAAIFGLIILGLATLQNDVIVLAIPLMAYLFGAIYWRPETMTLAVRRTVTPDYAPENTPVTVHLTVINQGKAIDEILLDDLIPDGAARIEGDNQLVTTLAPDAEVELEYTIKAPRGAYSTYELMAYARDFTGLFETQLIYRTRPNLVVHPRYPRLSRIKIRPPQTHGFAGPIAARQGGTGVDFWSVREYQSGDPQRQINWKRAARRPDEGLYTNIFEQEQVANVGLILDARERVNVTGENGSLFEESVQATAALAQYLLDEGNRVSLLLYGSGIERVFPGYGKVQRNRILKALARARTGLNYALETLDNLPTRFFPARSQIIFVSPLQPGDITIILQMRARGYAVILLSPDPIAYEAALKDQIDSPAYRIAAAERSFMLDQVRRSGVQVINWRVDQSLQAAVREVLAFGPPPIYHTRNLPS
jgi:uncharacterized protein (DUF58 family)